MPTRSEKISEYIRILNIVEQIRNEIANIEQLKEEKENNIKQLKEKKEKEIQRLEQEKKIALEKLEKKKEIDIKQIQQNGEIELDKLKKFKEQKEEEKDKLDKTKQDFEKENDSLVCEIEKKEQEKANIEDTIRQSKEQLKMDFVVDSAELDKQIDKLRHTYDSQIEDALRERDKLIRIFEKKKIKLKKVKKEIDVIDAEQICNCSSLNLNEMLSDCQLFDSDRNYLRCITESKWASLGIPIILGVLLLGLFMAGAFVFNWGFLNFAAKGIASFIWWIVEAVFLALASWLLGHFFALFSSAKGIPVGISIVILLIVNYFHIVPAAVVIAYILSIIYGFIIDSNLWDMDESQPLPCVSFGIILFLEIIWLHDSAFGWMNNIMSIIIAILVGVLVFWVSRLLFTETPCSKVMCLFRSVNSLKCTDILNYWDEVSKSEQMSIVNNITITYRIEDIIEIKIRQMAENDIYSGNQSAIKDEIYKQEDILQGIKHSIEQCNIELKGNIATIANIEKTISKLISMINDYSYQINDFPYRIVSKVEAKRKECNNNINRKEEDCNSYIGLTERNYDNLMRDKKEELKLFISSVESKVRKLGSSIKEIGDREYSYYEDAENGFKKYVRDVIAPLGKSFQENYGQSEDLMRITNGCLSDFLYFDKYNPDSDGCPDFEIINYNRDGYKKMVLLYDGKEVPYGNISEGLYYYVKEFAQAFLRINPTILHINPSAPIQHFCIIDSDSEGEAFKGDDRVFEIYSEQNDILSYLTLIKEQGQCIIEEAKEKSVKGNIVKGNIESLNEYMVKTDSSNGVKNYIITFILYGRRTRNNMNINGMWSFLNSCEKAGVIPIFFVDKELWCDNTENGIKSEDDIKLQVPDENVYYISREKHKDDTGKEHFYVNLKPYN